MNNTQSTNYILTDVLPAELPVIFSNRGFYDYLRDEDKLALVRCDKRYNTIPVHFLVKKQGTDYRTISLLNPVSEMHIASFIRKYESLLLVYFEQNSFFSIRHYNRINSAYVEIKDEELDEIKAIIDSELFDIIDYSRDKYIYNYFNIIPFYKITDFYKSYTLKDMEIKYRYMLKMDIENCFGSIYTHSVDWAFLGEKRTAKDNKNNTKRLSAILDNVMQDANYAETHGIVVGPEFSRMFAEVILTRVDKNVYEALKKVDIYYKKDYEIVRFIDDIFVFCSSRDKLESIEEVIKKCLEEYKLTINSKKQFIETVPFMRNHLWVTRAKCIINSFESGCKKLNEGGYQKAFIDICGDEIKALCVECESQMQYIISYFFSAFERIQDIYIESISRIKIDPELRDEKKASRIRIMQAKWVDLLAQCLVMSITHNNAIKFSRMCIKMMKNFSEDDISIQMIVFKKCSSLINYHRDTWTELQNVMILLAIVKERLLAPTLIVDLLEQDPGYLSVSTVVYYLLKTDPNKLYYPEVYQKIDEIIERELIICSNLYGIDYSTGKVKFLKEWICSDHFYLLHDIYSANVLSPGNMAKLAVIKKECKKTAGALPDAIKIFAQFIQDFDKPFMKWTASEDELITDFYLEKNKKKLQYD